MANKAGVWIDHKQAIVVLITDAGQETKQFPVGIEPSAQPAGRARPTNKHRPDDYVPEASQERKLVADRKKVFEQVLAYIHGANALLILGPGEAKGEFSKYIAAKKLRGLTVELETTDKMTARQLAAKVSAHFTQAPVGKSAAPKKMVQSVSGKRTKKNGK